MPEEIVCETIEDLERYIVEIISKIRAVKSKCDKYLTINFISDHPVKLAKVIYDMCVYCNDSLLIIFKKLAKQKNIQKDEIKANFNIIQIVDYSIRSFGEDLEYIDGVIPQNIPWSIIKHLEKLLNNIVSNISFMLRPQWEYNYSIISSDFRKRYMNRISALENTVNIPVKHIFEEFNLPFHIISFPYIEKSNVLLHCMIGHELGHLIIHEFVSDKSIDNLVFEVKDKIEAYTKSEVQRVYNKGHDEKFDMFLYTEYRKAFQYNLLIVNLLIKRGLEELLSDITGSLIFGPAMLFSIYEFALQSNFDEIPSEDNNFYPPWRYRLRESLKILLREGSEFFPLEQKFIESNERILKINAYFEKIKKIVNITSDIDHINNNEICKIAYDQIAKRIIDLMTDTNYFNETLNKNTIIPNILYKDIDILLDRYKNKLPPNAIEKSITNKRPASIVEIVNAGWFYKISLEQHLLNKDFSTNEDLFELRDALNRLTLKAIEFSDIESEFIKYHKRKK